ncbi:MAG TPA: hypothetical protein VGZ69_06315 [Candidatus Rhabdochlamydia sp.]|jgi:hypothetical protein|nr:hypothetical protein [Candidatus Rhabdochlamydia sp.]
MKITPYFYTPLPFVDKISRVKEWVYNATEVFIQFCTERIWHYLEQNYALQPYLQKINELCISEENPSLLEVHLTNICIILEKNPSLIETYIDLAQDVKDISPDLLELHQIANEYPELLETHLQAIKRMKKFKTNIPLLEIYLRTVKKLKNNPDNALTKQICGAFTSYQNLKKNKPLQDLFFTTTSHIWSLRKELAEPHLQSIHNLCNFKPLMLGLHLSISHLICSDKQIFEVHLSNMNSLQPQFLESYINTSFGLKDNQVLLKLYIHTIYIIKSHAVLDAHQQNTQAICKLQPHTLEAYFNMILYLENTNLLESYIHGIYHINHTSNAHLLASYFQKTYSIYHFNKDLLEPHFQNTCHLYPCLRNYIQDIFKMENDQDMACVVYSTHNVTDFSQSQSLFNLYLTVCQIVKNNQGNIFLFHRNAFSLSQKYPQIVKNYLETILFLENTLPSLSWLHLENIENIYNIESIFLSEYISTILEWIKANKEFSLPCYISSIYNSFTLAKDYPELVDLHNTTCQALEDKKEDVLLHFYNVLHIAQIHQQLLKDYLRIVLFLVNTHSNLLWPHLQNTQNIYASDATLFHEYISKILNLKNNQELLFIHICHTFNIHRLSKQHPSILPLYHSTADALEKHPESLSYHMYNTYRISILLTHYLKRYLNTIQKMIPVWMSQDESKCSWLNNHLQSIQRYSFEDTSALQKHLQLISQIDPIFKGRAFLIEEILKNMQEEEKREFISTSPEIMPYVTAKSIFLYGFHPKYHTLAPCFFNPKIQQEIATLREESHKHNISSLQKIFTNAIDFTSYWNQEISEDGTRAIVKKMQNLWVDATKGEDNLFMQCWKEAAKTLGI